MNLFCSDKEIYALANLTEVCIFLRIASDYQHVTYVITDSNEIYTPSAGERASA